jgi:hypothetical protein
MALENLALGLALLAYLVTRQIRWVPVDTTRIWRLPIVLGVVGLLTVGSGHARLSTADVAVLVLSAILALGSGTAMGRLAQFRPIPPTATPKRMRNGALPTLETRTGWAGAALWVGLIAARIGLDVAGSRSGAALATSGGVVLLVLALNRAARAVVFSARLDRHHHGSGTARVKMVG